MPTKKQKLIYKIIMVVSALIGFGIGIWLLVAMFTNNKNYFTQHFGLSIVLICVAVIAFLMPLATKTKYGGDKQKDELIMIVAGLLVVFAIVSIIMSYFNLGL